MNKDEIRAARHALGLSCRAFAEAVGVASGRTVRRWEAGDSPVPGSVAKLVVRLLADKIIPVVEGRGTAVIYEAEIVSGKDVAE